MSTSWSVKSTACFTKSTKGSWGIGDVDLKSDAKTAFGLRDWCRSDVMGEWALPAATVTLAFVLALKLKTAVLVMPLALLQGLALAVFQPSLFVSQMFPVFVLVTKAALTVPMLPKPRSARRRAERSTVEFAKKRT